MLGLGQRTDAALGLRTSSTAVALARRFYQNKPPTDSRMRRGSFTRRRGQSARSGNGRRAIRGVGEPPVGAAYGAIMNAIADAIGDEIFRRSPVVSADHHSQRAGNGGKRTHEALTAHIRGSEYGRDSRHHSRVRALSAGFDRRCAAIVGQVRRRRAGPGRRSRQHGLAEGSPQAAEGGRRPGPESRSCTASAS